MSLRSSTRLARDVHKSSIDANDSDESKGKKAMKQIIPVITIALIASATSAQEVQFETFPGIFMLDMSTDGSIIVGNNAAFEAVRWTRETGIVLLGRDTTSFGAGAGTPDISDDGTRVSATISTDDGLHITQGIWIEGQGWTELMPPPPVGGGLLDNAYGSAWGISGNGEHVVGLYWRPNNPGDGSAHASFSQFIEDGVEVIDLGSTVKSSRANHVNYDGTVVVGWDELATGAWIPTVWDNGILTRLDTSEGFAEANYVTPDGNLIGGDTYNDTLRINEATIWTRTGNTWTQNVLGSLLGTAPPFGLATVEGLTPDGSIAVGYNRRTNPLTATGFIWTAEDGMEDIVDWLTDRGVVLPQDFRIFDLASISADGKIMIGSGVNTINGLPIGFIITKTCQADITGDGNLNFFDVSAFLSAFAANDPVADFTDDGSWNFFDVSAFLTAFSAGCP